MEFTPAREAKRRFLWRLRKGTDLWEEVASFARDANVRCGTVAGLGAVERATFAYYDQTARSYQKIQVDRPCEILSLTGNISIKESVLFPHLHIVLGEADGTSLGGHLMPGTAVFACEINLVELGGPELVREPDPETGLPLWAAIESE